MAAVGSHDDPAPGAVHRQQRASPLWQCAKRHARELREAGRMRRAIERRVIERFIRCGDPHRQYVFTVPRLLRPIFGRHRAWLGELCRIAARLLVDAHAAALPGARPGLLLFVQTFGDFSN